jgi:HNH endonuclease/AP2 domain
LKKNSNILPQPSIDRLKDVLSYDKHTGVFRWKKTLSKRNCEGNIAGSFSKEHGYISICIDGKRYMAHRLAWLYEFGSWPTNDIDHINTIRNDNRICNLREATRADNLHNMSVPSHNTSGFKGVSWHKARGKWRATIKLNRRSIHLGAFNDKEEAANAYKEAASRLFGEFARPSSMFSP